MRKPIWATLAAVVIALAGCGGGDGADSAAPDAGHAADAADADRTIEIAALDSLKFEPDTVQVDAGETVTFEVTNEGSEEHELVLGIDSGAHDHMSHGSNGVYLPPGGTASFTWTFGSAGEIEFACHVNAHDQSGMVGVIKVT